MNLEEIMLYSFILRNAYSGDDNIESALMENYISQLFSIKRFDQFKNVINNFTYYEGDGYDEIKKGQKIFEQLITLAKPELFEQLIIQVDEYMTESSILRKKTNKEIDNTVFWNNQLSVVDSRVDEEERKIFLALLKAEMYISCICDDKIDNLYDLDLHNAKDMQETYMRLLKRKRNSTNLYWIISKLNAAEELGFCIEYINDNTFKMLFQKNDLIKYAPNLWKIRKKKESKSGFAKELFYCGLGRLTNLNIEDMSKIKSYSIVRSLMVNSSMEYDIFEGNPLVMISRYVDPNKKFLIEPKDFLRILNTSFMNARYKQLKSLNKCIICGKDCTNSTGICEHHFS